MGGIKKKGPSSLDYRSGNCIGYFKVITPNDSQLSFAFAKLINSRTFQAENRSADPDNPKSH